MLSPGGKVLEAFVGPPYYHAKKFSCVPRSHVYTLLGMLSWPLTLPHPNMRSPAWKDRRKELPEEDFVQGHTTEVNRN